MNKKVRKRGVSGVILTIIMIVLVLASVAVIWGIIQGILTKETEKIAIESVTINLEIQSVKIEGENISVGVRRNVGEGNLTGINFIFFDGENSENIERKFSLKELETNVLIFTLIKLNVSKIKRISIAPIFLLDSGKEFLGEIEDINTLGSNVFSGGSGDTGSGNGEDTGGDTGTCTPNPNACDDSGFVCGVSDDGCGTLVSCGTCNSGFICSENKTQCIEGSCTPDPGVCSGLECGNAIDSCGDLVGCGNCNTGESCTNGLCVPEACIPKNSTEACGSLVCGSADDGCGNLVFCGDLSGACNTGFICTAGACIAEISVNVGIVDLTWPPGINLFFDSVNLSKTESYVGKFAKFPGSLETRCLQITEHIFPSDPDIYNKSFVRLGTPNDEKTLISTGDNYEVWNSPNCGS